MMARLALLLALALPLAAGVLQAAPAVTAPASQDAAPVTVAQGQVAPGASTVTASPAASPSTSAASPAANAATSAAAPDVAAPNPNAAAANATAVPAIGVAAAAPRTVPATLPSATPTAGLLQTLLALIAVLAVLGALAWFLKRYGPRAGGGSANLRIVGALNLGGRERLLVVEVGNQWIVVGAAPGRVNGLATMPRQEGAEATAALLSPAPAAASFGDWLKHTLDKRK